MGLLCPWPSVVSNILSALLLVAGDCLSPVSLLWPVSSTGQGRLDYIVKISPAPRTVPGKGKEATCGDILFYWFVVYFIICLLS